jgi:hypothetical protein
MDNAHGCRWRNVTTVSVSGQPFSCSLIAPATATLRIDLMKRPSMIVLLRTPTNAQVRTSSLAPTSGVSSKPTWMCLELKTDVSDVLRPSTTVRENSVTCGHRGTMV